MDFIVLFQLSNSNPLSGYDIKSNIHDKFGLLMSSGTIYSLLYRMERDGVIEGKWNQRKRVYKLTHKGEENVKLLQQSSEKIPRLLMDIFDKK